MRRIVLAAAALAVAGIGTLGLFALSRHGAPPPRPSLAAPSPPAASAVRGPESGAPASPAASATAAASSEPRASPPPSLAFLYTEVDTTKAAAEACLSFSESLDASGQTDYGAYLSLHPPAQPSLKIDGRRLCLAGLEFGAQYQAELKAGFPAASGARLPAAQTVEIALSDRPALIAFRDGLILPRESVAGVPVTTVNVDRVFVTVIRVPDRLVSQIRRDQLVQRSIYPYQLASLQGAQGAVLWQGELAVTGPRNASVTTMFPLGQAVPQRRPGVYVLTAENAADRKRQPGEDGAERYDYRPRPVQWVIDTDIGLTTFQGADGLHVFARGLGSALPLSGLTMTLIARDNDELATAESDAEGHVRFDPGLLRGTGGAAPVAAMAYGKDGDFSLEDITRPAFDLSDRGVDGRALPGPVDAFLYTDRGIYRPRETVHLVTLLRDRAADAIEATPVTLVVRRPDGVEYRRATLADRGGGAMHYALGLTETAAHGRWQVDAFLDPKERPVGHAEFDVADFVPERLKVELQADAPAVVPGEPIPVAVTARFLYGAPGAELQGEADATIRPDPAPFADYRSWRFGLAEERFKEQVIELEVPQTDDQGRSKLGGQLDKVAASSLPLKADIRVAIFEPGGRSTETRLALPLRTRPLLIGLRPRFRDNRIAEDSAAAFDVAALDAAGKPVARQNLRVTWVRERSEYNWYRTNGGYRFERTTYDEPIDEGTLSLAADAPGVVTRQLPWGYYRLVLRDDATGAATSIRFSSGWRGDLSEDRPDKSEVSADKESYRAGDTARLAIRPPTSGEGLLVIANDRVLATRLLHVPAEGATVEVPVTAEWGTGAYAIFAQYRPLRDGNDRAPSRSIGVAWLPLDAAERTLAVEAAAPDRVLPRQTVEIPLTVKNLTAGAKAFVTLAAVDEGILQLTRFESPTPARFYFGKRRLALDIRDDYGRLIAGEGRLGAIRQGGDSIGGAALPVVPTRTVALFSGLVEVDAAGRARVPLAIPDFEGELRLMVVAFDRHKAGQAELHLTVRDPVVSEATLPRFLAPDDRSQLSLSLHNLDGKSGDYRAAFTAEGAVALPAERSRNLTLGQGERQLLAFPIAAKSEGIGTVSLHLAGPDGFAVDRQWQIAVRSPQDPITRSTVAVLAAGKDARLDLDLLASYLPGTATASLNLASWRSLPIAGVLRELDRYPYGCIEQTTSRAFPLLYFNDVALIAEGKDDPGVPPRVQGAIDRILDMQRAEGNFGFWGGGSEPAYDWLGVYALDFLHAARAKGFAVSDAALQRGEAWLRRLVEESPARTVSYRGQPPAAVAATRDYAAYVLARINGASLADLRYLYDTTQSDQRRALPAGQLAAALAFAGDVARGRAGFASAEGLALGPVGGPFRYFYEDDHYGTSLRDWAGLVRIAAEAKQSAVVNRLLQRFDQVDEIPGDLTTQEKAWLMLAEHALAQGRRPLAIAVNGAAVAAQGDPLTLTPDAAALARGYTVTNRGDRDVFVTVSVTGAPQEMLPPEEQGVSLERNFFTLDGRPADLAGLRQNDRLIVTLSGRLADQRHHEMILRDLLPAGFEIETVIQGDQHGSTAYPWLPNQRATRMREARDDRYVASFVVTGGEPRYYYYYNSEDREAAAGYDLAYMVRAVTPGTYVLPAATVEDMYRPSVRARTAAKSVTVLAR